MSVYAKLMQARVKLQGTKLEKSGKNTFAKYSYFELSDFLPTAQAIFLELGLCGVVSFGTDTATLTIRDVEGDGEIVITSPMSTAALKGCHEVQNLGAVQTYLRRYLWVTALEIVEHDALDSGQSADDASKKPDIAAILKGISGATSMEILRGHYEAAMQMLPEAHHAAIKKATSARKAELTPAEETE